jgi:hypothetical protein
MGEGERVGDEGEEIEGEGGIERSDLHAKHFAYLEDESRKFSKEIMQKDTARHFGGHLKRQLSEI